MRAELAERVARACRVIGKLDLTRSMNGHVSARLPGTDHILIRARGPGESGVRYTTADDVIAVDLQGRQVDGRSDLAVSMEVYIHTALYRARPDVNAVLHTHPATVVLMTICDKPLLPLFGAYDPSCLRLMADGIAEYPRSVLIATDALGQELADTMKAAPACLMRGHGVTTCGPSIEAAALTAIKLNELAEMNYRALLLGGGRPIPDDELAGFVEKRQSIDP